MDNWLRRSGRGSSNLSLSGLNGDDLRAHVLIFENLLALDALVDGVDDETLLDREDEEAPEANPTDHHIPEVVGLATGDILGHVWELVEPFLVWVSLLFPVVLMTLSVLLIVLIVVHWMSTMLSMRWSMVSSMMSHRTMVTPEVSGIDIIYKWSSIEFIFIIKTMMTGIHWLLEIIPFSTFNLWPVWVRSWLKLWFIRFILILWLKTRIRVGLVVVRLLDLLNIVS